jgi:hypothetical protein
MQFQISSLIDSDCPDCGGLGKDNGEMCHCILEAYQREKKEYHLTLS